MSMYSSKVDANFFNISIDGLDMIAEEVTSSEAYNRRETVRKNIIGGTQYVIRAGYIPRHSTIVTHFLIDPDYPDVYDDIFREWQSKPVEVISRYLGGKYNAEITVKRDFRDSPNYLRVELDIIEIPTSESNIPNDVLKIPADEITSVSNATSDKTSTASSTTPTATASTTNNNTNTTTEQLISDTKNSSGWTQVDNGKGGNITNSKFEEYKKSFNS